jgi:hypothetical protein
MKRDITPVIEKEFFDLTKISPLGDFRGEFSIPKGELAVHTPKAVASIVNLLTEKDLRLILSKIPVGESFMLRKGFIEAKGTVLGDDLIEIPCVRILL